MAALLSSTYEAARSPKKGGRARLRAALQLRWLRFLLVIGLASFIAMSMHRSQVRWFQYVDNLVLDQGFELRPPAEPPVEPEPPADETTSVKQKAKKPFHPSDIVVITLPHGIPRSLLGQILRKTGKADAVAIDMMLSDRAAELSPTERTFPIYKNLLQQWKAEDEAFAREVQRNGRVILGQWPEEVLMGTGAMSRKARIWQRPPAIIWNSAKYHANFWVEPDVQDSIIRTLRPFQNIPDGKKMEHVPALGVAVAAAKLGISSEKLAQTRISGDSMQFGSRRVPLQNGLLTINYWGDRNYFETNSSFVYDLVLDDFLETKDIEGKLVFIGETSFKSKDIFTTPFGDMPGVHIHAHTVMTLLDSRGAPQRASTWWAVAVGILGSLLLVFPVLRWPSWAVLLLTIFMMVLVALYAQSLFASQNVLMAASIPCAIIALCGASFVALEHGFMRSALGRFVGQDALPRVSGTFGRLEPGGDEDDTAAFICDLRGFSTLSQGLPPKEAGILVSEYAGVIIEAVWPYGGHVADFAGDGALVIFPRSWVGDDYIWKAAQAAVALREQMDKWQSDWTERGWGEVRFGVGLHCDRAWVGLIGVEKLLKVGAAGDAINVASRVQTLSKNTDHDILITEPVYQAIRQKIDAVPLGAKELTGREGTILVYGLHELCISSRPYHDSHGHIVKILIAAAKRRLKIS